MCGRQIVIILLLPPLNFEEERISSNSKIVGVWRSSSGYWVAGLDKQINPPDVD